MCTRWRRRAPPRFVPEALEAAALSLLMASPVAGPVALGKDEGTLPPPPSLASNVDKQHMTQVERCTWKVSHSSQPLPYVPLDVAEARSVTAHALQRWSNKRVRLIGAMEHDAVPWLVSLDPKDGACRVALDLSNLLVWPPLERPVQVFGTLGVESVTGIPEVQVLFYRPLQSEYLKRYINAVDAQRPFVPLFVKKVQRGRKRLDSDSSEEADVECALDVDLYIACWPSTALNDFQQDLRHIPRLEAGETRQNTIQVWMKVLYSCISCTSGVQVTSLRPKLEPSSLTFSSDQNSVINTLQIKSLSFEGSSLYELDEWSQ